MAIVFDSLSYLSGGLTSSTEAVTKVILQLEYTGIGSLNYDYGPNLITKDVEVTVTATPATGYVFLSWEEYPDASTNSITIAMVDDITLTANFQKIYELTLTVTGNGTTTPDPVVGIKYEDSYVNIIAVADPGWTFYGWRIEDKNYSSNVLLVLQMIQDYDLQLMFIRDYYSVKCTPSVGGVVTGVMNKVKYGTCATLEAIPDDGYEFVEWIGDVTGDVNPNDICITGDMRVVASFNKL